MDPQKKEKEKQHKGKGNSQVSRVSDYHKKIDRNTKEQDLIRIRKQKATVSKGGNNNGKGFSMEDSDKE